MDIKLNLKKILLIGLALIVVALFFAMWRISKIEFFPESYSSKVVISTKTSRDSKANLYYYEEGAAGTGRSTKFVELQTIKNGRFNKVLVSDFIDSIEFHLDSLVIYVSEENYELLNDNSDIKIIPKVKIGSTTQN